MLDEQIGERAAVADEVVASGAVGAAGLEARGRRQRVLAHD
jgi:hypothetical protein